MSNYLIVAVNTNKGHISLITKYPMTYDEAIKFIEQSNTDRGYYPNTVLTLAEVFK
jgi:hypothetical protein